MDSILAAAGTIAGVHIEQIRIEDSFADFAGRFENLPGTVVLLSGGDLDCARYHILAAKPWLTFKGLKRKMQIILNDDNNPDLHRFEGDPFNILKILVKNFKLEEDHLPAPVAAGLFGYLSYDLKDHIERLPATTVNDLGLPEICFFAPSLVVIHDKKTCNTRLAIPKLRRNGQDKVEDVRQFFFQQLKKPVLSDGSFSGGASGFKSGFTRPDYEAAIKKIIDYIAAGHVYQVNMSQRFLMDFSGDAFALFKSLYQRNPAPFFAYINAGDHRVLCTSPERFIFLDGHTVETRPIKGTMPRDADPQQDARYKAALLRNKKDDAELSMIVDLLRNDMGKVCVPGTVKVAQHKRLEAYRNVYHLVSIVKGQLDPEYDAVDLIKATFPGGSITGCPKIRAMEIIDELEPVRRHVYTGSIGYIGFHGSMDLNIAIRTAMVQNDQILFSVGGGIVYDSDPGSEYEETLHKGRTLMEAFTGVTSTQKHRDYGWIDGVIKPLDDIRLPINSFGVQYGHGFFETILARNGSCPLLEKHLSRLARTWDHLMPGPVPDLTWHHIIAEVLTRNGLDNQTAAVKIAVFGGNREIPPWDHHLVVTARPYEHRLATLKTDGLRLVTFPEPRQTPLADYKTLNYLFYHRAGEWAQKSGAHEALILNPDQTISETNTANILLIKEKKVLCPHSAHVLPGVMQGEVLSHLAKIGYQIDTRPVTLKEITDDIQVLLSNALMGLVPVMAIDGQRLVPAGGLCKRVNEAILNAANA